MLAALLPLLLASLLTLLPTPTTASSSNFTLRHEEKRGSTASWTTEKCATVAGTYYGYKYNFGCLCANDLDDYCNNNNINDYIQGLISQYINYYGKSASYPPNSQPTCDGYGGYSCGSLSKLSNGNCGQTVCNPNKCSTNGGCCPRGQTYYNGQCCGTTGCGRNGRTCTPVLQCTTYENNDVCCPSGTSGWKGYDTICCPSGQYESNKQCVCPAGQQISANDPNKCTTTCSSGTTWCKSKCCPNGSSEDSTGTCVCPAGQKFNDRQTACVDICNTSGGMKWCNTQCCPNGASEVNGACKCDSNQQTLNSGKTACVDRCASGWTYYNTQCCPAGSTEVNGVCTCTSSQQSITGSQTSTTGYNDNRQCSNKCASGFTFYSTTCCPAGSTEVNKQCVCTSNQQQLTGSGNSAACTNKCTNSAFTFYSTICCPAGSTEVNKQCVCSSTSQQITGSGVSQTCTNKCQSTQKWCKSTCCKSYLDETSTGTCACSQIGYIDNGSACVPKCSSGTTYNTNTGNCDQICDTSAGYVFYTGWTGAGFCCKKGQTACNTVCCPAGQEEVGKSGKCCKIGSTLNSYGQCATPTNVPTNGKRALTGRAIQLSPTMAVFGIEANKDNKLCPAGLAACPIPGRVDEGEYECLDSMSDLQSCGGCASLGTGRDCTAIKGARWMGCNVGQCEVYSCKAGWRKLADGSGCEKI